ncbi:hypothetical protein PROCH_1483 [Prochlorococcus marinus str. EQPAC1]|nr:hypothetical protein PROCH_1483 [Prochlorococcus marinus str. EQPAC1]
MLSEEALFGAIVTIKKVCKFTRKGRITLPVASATILTTI